MANSYHRKKIRKAEHSAKIRDGLVPGLMAAGHWAYHDHTKNEGPVNCEDYRYYTYNGTAKPNKRMRARSSRPPFIFGAKENFSRFNTTMEEFSKEDKVFRKACELANIEASPRQASKWRNQKGLARQFRLPALRELAG